MADSGVSLDRVLVIIPTYNEAQNIRPITARIRAAVPGADILIADDNSPDGTGQIADELAAADSHLHVLHRKGKEGLGAAYVAGFRWGLERGYDVLVEHDADGSHQPEQLPLLLDRLKTADAVKGSRWVKGGSVVNWSKFRELLSRGGNLWTRLVNHLPIDGKISRTEKILFQSNFVFSIVDFFKIGVHEMMIQIILFFN